MSHASQHEDQSRIDPAMRGWGAANAALAGLDTGRFVEVFQRVGM